MLVGTFLLTGVIFLSSQSFSQMLWRLAAGVYVLACCAALGFPGFFAGAQAYSARFSGFDRPLLQFHWPVEFSPDLIAGARQGLCAWGVVCDRLAQWPLALTGSYWLQVSIIVGAIAVAIRMRPPLARVGALFAVLWIVLLAVWTGANLGIMAAFSLSPIYFFLMMYPFWAFFSLYAGVRLIEITTSRFVPKARSADPAWFAPPFAWRLSRSSRFSRPRSLACSNGAAFRAAPRRRLRKLCGRTSRCFPARPIADRSPLSSVRREVRCGVNCWSKPSSRSSPTSSNDFFKSWQPTPAARTTCSTCGGSISRPCRSMARASAPHARPVRAGAGYPAAMGIQFLAQPRMPPARRRGCPRTRAALTPLPIRDQGMGVPRAKQFQLRHEDFY
jgi:hypothetical protein